MMKKQNWADAVEAIYHQKELLDTAMCSYGENVYDQIIKRFFRCSLAPIEQGKIEAVSYTHLPIWNSAAVNWTPWRRRTIP